MLDNLAAIWAMNVQNSDGGDPAETFDWLVYRIGRAQRNPKEAAA
jgi:hypothetical protein